MNKDFDTAISELQAIDTANPQFEKAQAKLSEYGRYKVAADEARNKAELRENIQEAKSHGIFYKRILKNPDDTAGLLVAWKGRVMNITEDGGTTNAQVQIWEDGPGMDNFFVSCKGSYDVLQNDYVVVYGRFTEMREYKSVANYNMRSPVVEGFTMKKIPPLSPY